MKNTVKVFALLVALVVSSCTNSVDSKIKDYLKANADDPNSVELVETELIQTETVSTTYKKVMHSLSDEELSALKPKEAEILADESPASYCYVARFRAKNYFGELVLQEISVLFDSEMNIVADGSGLLTLDFPQRRDLVLQR